MTMVPTDYAEHMYTTASTGGPGTWTIVCYGNEVIHSRELDPGESYIVQVNDIRYISVTGSRSPQETGYMHQHISF